MGYKTKKASNMIISKINILFLVLLGPALVYSMGSREGITIEVTTLSEDNEYLVCVNLKK